MSADGETYAGGRREPEGLDASQYATTAKPRVNAQGNDPGRKAQGQLSLIGLREDIYTIKRGLEEEGVKSQWLTTLGELATRVPHASSNGTARLDAVADRLRAIEETLKKALNPTPISAGKATWASVAAGGTRQACGTHVTPPRATLERHTVRASIPKTKEKTNEEILKEVKKTIPGAAAVRVLRSGDVDITVPDETTKDRAQGIPPTADIRIHKQDYIVEVPGVPLSTRVVCGKDGDNTLIATAICEASRTLAPGLRITRVQWLYSRAQLDRLREAGKQRGTLLLGFQTQEMRRKAIQGGLVIGAELFEARQFDKSIRETQCFKCLQWGHTQHACVKPARCARCAGPHGYKECARKEGEPLACANCGKRHQAWQRRNCTAYQTYHDSIQRRRIEMLAQTYSIRTARKAQPTLADGWTRVTNKRAREESPKESQPRRIGRPTGIEQAAKDPSQARIVFAGSSHEGSQQQPEIEMDTTGSDE